MAGKHFFAQPDDRTREQRVGNALQRRDGEPNCGENAHAELCDPYPEQHGDRHICCRAHAAGDAVIDGAFVMLKIGAQLEIERIYRERERQEQRITNACNSAAHREKQQKKKEHRLKRQHWPEHIRRVEARRRIHKRGKPGAEEKPENASQCEQGAELCVAVAERAEIHGGKAAGEAENHPEGCLIERVIYRDPFRAHAAPSFAFREKSTSIIHKGHAGVKSERLAPACPFRFR